jgi:hypothetical protein
MVTLIVVCEASDETNDTEAGTDFPEVVPTQFPAKICREMIDKRRNKSFFII